MADPRQVLVNLNLASMMAGANQYGLLEHGAIAVEGEKIAWAGRQQDMPDHFAGFPRKDIGGRLVTPALIDCHTHLVFAGNRALEFEMRLNGASYEEIGRAGGGIVATVNATRAVSRDQLLAETLPRIDALIAEGVSLVEIKSGYGLEQKTELGMLRVARRIAQIRPIKVRASFLGAHALPPEFAGRADAYIDQVCIPTLRAAHREGLVDAVDGFCETIGFEPYQIAKIFEVAKELDLPVKLHADQLSNSGGTLLAARYGALSADHIEYADEAGVKAMAEAKTCAVILPGAFYTIGEKQAPPIDLLRQYQVPMALATDANPGSSPLNSILLAMNMACTLFGLTPEEALVAVTRNAAKALGLNDYGTITVGQCADLAVWNVGHPGELAYRIGFNPLYARIFGGRFERSHH